MMLGLLFDRGRLSKAELGAASRLSKPTVGQSLARLAELGLVRVSGSRTGRPGPAAAVFEIDPSVGSVVVVDVGDDDVRGIAVTTGGISTPEVRVHPGGRDVVAVLKEIYGPLTRDLPLADGAEHVMVVAVSGAYDPRADLVHESGHLSSRIKGLDRPGLLRRLRHEFGSGVAVENDVNLVALAEHAEGVAVGAATTALFWADYGVGAAGVIDGRIHRGATGGAGELAYLPVAGATATSSDDPKGGFQVWAGGEAVTALGTMSGLTGTPVQMLETAAANEDAHDDFLTAVAERYAKGISAMVVVLDPDIVVLSGRFAFAGGDVLSSRVADCVAEQSMRPVPVLLGALSESPVLAGAMSLARRLQRSALLDRVDAPV